MEGYPSVAPMSAQTALDYRTNRDLFSNYHLDEHLPETEAWNEIDEEEIQADSGLRHDQVVDVLLPINAVDVGQLVRLQP